MLSWRSSQSHQTVDLASERATGVRISHSALIFVYFDMHSASSKSTSSVQAQILNNETNISRIETLFIELER